MPPSSLPSPPAGATGATRALKAASVAFRDVSSRALRSDEGEARANLQRLLRFVAGEPRLAAAVAAAPPPQSDVAALWEGIREHDEPHDTGRLALPVDPQEELGLLHAVVTYLATAAVPFENLAFGYGGHYKRDEAVEDVLDHVVNPYVAALNQVIEMALLDANDPAYGPARGLAIHVSGGTAQVNVAQDAARVDAAQHTLQQTGADAAALVAQLGEALRAFRAAARDASVDLAVREDAEGVAAAVTGELERPAPNRFTLRKAREHLEELAAGGQAAGRLAAQAGPLAALLAEWWHRLPS